MAVAGPTHDDRSWTFDLDPGGRDPVLGIERLQEAYLARDPGYDRGVTVPAVVDVPTGRVVTNDFGRTGARTPTRRPPGTRRIRPGGHRCSPPCGRGSPWTCRWSGRRTTVR